eukprot:3227929-Pleurochrysis_carterae.AAC.1
MRVMSCATADEDPTALQNYASWLLNIGNSLFNSAGNELFLPEDPCTPPEMLWTFKKPIQQQKARMILSCQQISLNPARLQKHNLVLKSNMPAMLIRNLNAHRGLCNGIRLLVRSVLTTKSLRLTLSYLVLFLNPSLSHKNPEEALRKETFLLIVLVANFQLTVPLL